MESKAEWKRWGVGGRDSEEQAGITGRKITASLGGISPKPQLKRRPVKLLTFMVLYSWSQNLFPKATMAGTQMLTRQFTRRCKPAPRTVSHSHLCSGILSSGDILLARTLFVKPSAPASLAPGFPLSLSSLTFAKTCLF